MNYFKVLYGLDIPNKSLSYKNLKMAVGNRQYFFLFKKLHVYQHRSFRHWSSLYQNYTKRKCLVIVNNVRSVHCSDFIESSYH
jgi:hypothetical protein